MTSMLKWIGAGVAVVAVAIAAVIAIQSDRGPRGPLVIVPRDAPKHGFMGIDFEPERDPLTVKHVRFGTGAFRAGIQPGDVIVGIEDIDLPKLEELLGITRESEPDSTIRLTIRRNGMDQELEVRLVSYAELLMLRDARP